MTIDRDFFDPGVVVLSTRSSHRRSLSLQVKRLDARATLPKYQTDGAAGLDLHALLDHDVRLWPGERKVIKTGLAIALPEGFMADVRGRSGCTMRGLTVHLGTIDCDYRGEIGIIVEASPDENLNVVIKPGDRIAQLVVTKATRCHIEEVDSLDDTARGANGFGSTGAR